MHTYTIKPGLLVSVSTTLRGNVSYRKSEIKEGIRKGGSEFASWRMDREIADKAEHERAKIVRGAAVYTVRRVCSTAACGYLCQTDNAAALNAAVAQAQKIIAEFNASATVTRLGFHVAIGSIETGDSVTSRSVSSEVSDLLDAMQQGLRDRDATAVRDAASKLKAIAPMLSDTDCKRVERAVSDARLEARSIGKDGDSAPSTVEPADTATAPKPEPATAPADDDAAAMTDSERALAAMLARKRKAKRDAASVE